MQILKLKITVNANVYHKLKKKKRGKEISKVYNMNE